MSKALAWGEESPLILSSLHIAGQNILSKNGSYQGKQVSTASDQPLLLKTLDRNTEFGSSEAKSDLIVTEVRKPEFLYVEETRRGNIVFDTDISCAAFKIEHNENIDNVFVYKPEKPYSLNKLRIYYMFLSHSGVFEWGSVNVYENQHLNPTLRDSIPKAISGNTKAIFLWITASFYMQGNSKRIVGRTTFERLDY